MCGRIGLQPIQILTEFDGGRGLQQDQEVVERPVKIIIAGSLGPQPPVYNVYQMRPPKARPQSQQRQFEFLILEYNPPGHPSQNIGAMVWDIREQCLVWELIPIGNVLNLDEIGREVLHSWTESLLGIVNDSGPQEVLEWLEDTLSNALTLTSRQRLLADTADEALKIAFAQHVQPQSHCL